MTTNHNPMTNTNPVPRKPEGNAPEQLLYVYFVSVFDITCGNIRTSQLEVFRPSEILTVSDVLKLQQWVRTEYGFENPSVMGVSLLRKVPASQLRGRS